MLSDPSSGEPGVRSAFPVQPIRSAPASGGDAVPIGIVTLR